MQLLALLVGAQTRCGLKHLCPQGIRRANILLLGFSPTLYCPSESLFPLHSGFGGSSTPEAAGDQQFQGIKQGRWGVGAAVTPTAAGAVRIHLSLCLEESLLLEDKAMTGVAPSALGLWEQHELLWKPYNPPSGGVGGQWD